MPDFAPKNLLALARLHRWWVGGGVVTVVAVAASVWMFWRDLPALEASYRDRTTADQATLAAQFSEAKLKEEVARLRDATRQIEQHLAIETNLADNNYYFYQLEEETRCRLEEMHPLSSSPPPAQSPYRTIPYSLKVSGAYEQTAAFLHRLETGPRLLKITSFSFRRRDPDGTAVLLDLQVELLGQK